MGIRRYRLALPLVMLLAPAAVLGTLAPLAAGAGGGDGGGSKHPTKSAAPSAQGRAYSALCAQGNAKFAARDFDGAIEIFRKAIELSPHQGLGHYLLGETQLAAGNQAEAEASWGHAALESSSNDPALHARVLFVLADLKEREKKWDEAKAAWQVYLDWAALFPDAGAFPESARSRQQVIDTALKQEQAYETVRARIAATADGGVFSDSNKSPPAK